MTARIDSLTGLRAVAALAVCVTHAAFWTGLYTDDLPGRFFARFEVGVAVFFVLSGYLLYRPWVAAMAARSARPSLRRYCWHRVRRILPAYWLTVLAVYAIYRWWLVDDSTTGRGPSGLLRNLTLTQVYGYGYLHSGLTQMWSLCAEVVYYVALPPLAIGIARWVCRRRWRPGAVSTVLAVSLLVSPVWAIVIARIPDIDPTARLWAPAFATWFLGGMLLAVLSTTSVRPHALLSVLIALLAFVVSIGQWAGEPTITPSSVSANVFKLSLYLVVAVGIIAPLTMRSSGDWWDRVLSWPPLVWVGEISYEFFCVHVIVLEVVMHAFGFRVFSGSLLIVAPVTMAISVVTAWALHRLVRPLWSARTSGAAALIQKSV